MPEDAPMHNITEKRFRGSIGDRELAKGRLADEILAGVDKADD